MAGFERGSYGIGSDRSANCATTTALEVQVNGFGFSSFRK